MQISIILIDNASFAYLNIFQKAQEVTHPHVFPNLNDFISWRKKEIK